jgi:Ankyrin repeats (3 copies)
MSEWNLKSSQTCQEVAGTHRTWRIIFVFGFRTVERTKRCRRHQIDSWKKAPVNSPISKNHIMLMLLAPDSAVDVPGDWSVLLVEQLDFLVDSPSSSSSSSYLKTGSIWYWIVVAMVAVKIVRYSHCHRLRMSLLRWILQAVERLLGGAGKEDHNQHNRWSAVFLAWLDDWCCLPLECTSSNDPENKKLDDQLPSSCCPKRRARWEKNWQRKCARHHNNPKDSCFLSKLFFCLPPPLPLQRAGEQQHTSRSITETSTTANDAVPEEPVLEDEEVVAHLIEHQEQESKPSTAPASDVSAGPTTVSLVQQRRAAPPPPAVVHLIDQVRMQQWSTLLAQPKWRRRQVKYRDTDGLYPLHWAAAGGSPVAVVDRLLETAGYIAHYPDNEGSLPLHFAAHYAASRDVLAALWRAYPNAIFHRDRYGRTPLYHAVDKSLSLATLQLLIQNSSTIFSDTTEEAMASTTTSPHYELITTPCYTPQGATRREQATRTPLFMVWASVLNNREARVKWRGKTWDKAVWMLQHSYRYHYADLATTTADLLPSSLISICLRMDLYLPDPVVSLVLANAVPGGVNNRLADLVVAAATPSYSLERILELIHHFRQLGQVNDDDDDVNGTAALAAARAGQPWEVLERLPHRDRHALAIVAALANPIVYEQMPTAPFQQDPLGLLRRLHTPKDKSSSSSSSSSTEETMTTNPTTTIRPVAVDPPPNNNGGGLTTTMETVYRLLRENPGQLLLRTTATTAPAS